MVFSINFRVYSINVTLFLCAYVHTDENIQTNNDDIFALGTLIRIYILGFFNI